MILLCFRLSVILTFIHFLLSLIFSPLLVLFIEHIVWGVKYFLVSIMRKKSHPMVIMPLFKALNKLELFFVKFERVFSYTHVSSALNVFSRNSSGLQLHLVMYKFCTIMNFTWMLLPPTKKEGETEKKKKEEKKWVYNVHWERIVLDK